MKKLFYILFFLLLNFSICFADFNQKDYKFYKNLFPVKEEKGDFYFVIDEDLYQNTNRFLSDIRIIENDKREIPYFIKKDKDITNKIKQKKSIKILSKTTNGRGHSMVYLLDLGEQVKYHNAINILTTSTDFRRFVSVFGSYQKDGVFEDMTENVGVGDQIMSLPEGVDLEIRYKYNNYRFLKIEIFGGQGNFEVNNFYYLQETEQKIPGRTVNHDLILLEKKELEQKTQMLLESPVDGIPTDTLVIKTEDQDFVRHVKIYISNNKNSVFLTSNETNNKPLEGEKYWEKVYDGKLKNQFIQEDFDKIAIKSNKKYFFIEIDNGDEKPLEIINIEASYFVEKIYINDIDFSKNTYKLYFANPNAKKIFYNIEEKKNVKYFLLAVSDFIPNQAFDPTYQVFYKKAIFYVYLGFFLFFMIVIWFFYKILSEDKHRDIDDNKFVEKL